ncbi:MAG: VWA domain-containing protein [Candidatus Omnitrophica bacterium]|nr:VWA domain-containing protein [Candidatus Omnitrophota bacterium]
MHFGQLNMLVWLWSVVGLVAFLIWAKRHRKGAVERFAQEQLVDELANCFHPKKAKIKQVLLVGIFVFSVLALIRPQWGFQWREVKRQGIDILVVVDTSKSMLTQDVKPNRLERTKFAVQDLLKKLKGDRIGLIAFSGASFLVCPLTVDYGGFQASLKGLNVDTIPRGGTNLAKAIQEAIKDYDETASEHKAIVIVTDGDDLEGDPITAAKKAKEKGIKVYCVGIGSDEGELIQLKREDGQATFLKDREGNYVKSRLNENLLKQIALITGGIYVRASGSQFGLDLIYERELSKLEKRDIEEKMEKRYFERFQFPLAAALLLLVVETCLSTRKKQI